MKPKIALTWCAGCGGCEESVIDLGPGLLDLFDRFEVAYWPVAVDRRRRDLEQLADGELAGAFVNGALRTEEDLEMVHLLRRKARVLVAHGACAQLGGVLGLANQRPVRELLQEVFCDQPNLVPAARETAGESSDPATDLPALPELLARVAPLSSAVAVDRILPGCPPEPAWVERALDDLGSDRPLASGFVYAEPKALCATCPRRATLDPQERVPGYRRFAELAADPERCFLAQQLLCLGPATRGGCGARCIEANMPCRGCYGAPEGVRDFGTAALGFAASLVAGDDVIAAEAGVASIPDPSGLFHRYCLAASLLGMLPAEPS